MTEASASVMEASEEKTICPALSRRPRTAPSLRPVAAWLGPGGDGAVISKPGFWDGRQVCDPQCGKRGGKEVGPGYTGIRPEEVRPTHAFSNKNFFFRQTNGGPLECGVREVGISYFGRRLFDDHVYGGGLRDIARRVNCDISEGIFPLLFS